MVIGITGGTGFIGSRLQSLLTERGHTCIIFTRKEKSSSNPSVRYVQWNYNSDGAWQQEVAGCDAVIHLAGKSVADGRWTDSAKKEILESRTLSTRALVQAMKAEGSHCKALICASAVGYYGSTGDAPVTEENPPANDFLAKVCIAWESEAQQATRFGIRVAIGRIGVVLGVDGGALQKMLLPFRLGIGGPIGSGKQYMPWIHQEDVAQAFAYLTEHDSSGIFNFTAPNPVTMNEFASLLGKTLGRPSIFSVPSFVISALMGEAAAIVLNGQRTSSEKLITSGFSFRFPSLSEAFANLLK